MRGCYAVTAEIDERHTFITGLRELGPAFAAPHEERIKQEIAEVTTQMIH